MYPILWNLIATFRSLANREDGQDMVEYALIVALIGLACVAATRPVGVLLNTIYNELANAVTTTIN